MAQRGVRAAVVVVLVLACDHPLPSAPRAGARRAPAPSDLAGGAQVTGCGRFDVSIGRPGAAAFLPADTTLVPACGDLRIVPAGPPLSLAGAVRLPVRLRNAGTRPLVPPALLLGWEDSLEVTSPPGLARNVHTSEYLSYANADSTIGRSASQFANAAVWVIDSSLFPGGGQLLAPDTTSGIVWIDVAVHPGVKSFSLTLWASDVTGGAPVPLTPPDSVPATLFDSVNLTTDATRWGSVFMRDIVMLRFAATATEAQRQAAVDGVAGTVVGGHRFSTGDGLYLIHVPDDTTNNRLFVAIDALRANPIVRWAMPNSVTIGGTTSLRPSDGPGMRRSDWQLDPNAAFGNPARRTWALEAVDAPLAWGCITGDTTRVGEIDLGVHRVGDIVPNVAPESPMIPADSFMHGTDVASVIAAQGNDGSGMTGMMWHAKLEMYDISDRLSDGGPYQDIGFDQSGHLVLQEMESNDRLFTAVNGLLMHHARVINISLGVNGVQADPHTSKQTLERAQVAHVIADGVRYQSPGPSPLWVISAGNMTEVGDTYWSTLTAIADSLPGLIVTGAGATPGSLSRFATGTGRIDIAAPGDAVTVMDVAGVHPDSGSSFAAPLVTGAAGLLFSWDPTLTADQVRRYLIEGADSSGRRAHGIPLLDVYWSLRLAARRPNAPVCGNRVFVDQLSRLVIERDPSVGQASDEVVPDQSTSGSLVFTTPVHDGRYLSMFDGDSEFTMVHRNGGWVRDNMVPDSVQNSWVRSFAVPDGLVSHDADTTLLVHQIGAPNFSFDLSVRDSTGLVHPVATIPGFETGQAYPMIGDEILVSVAASNSFGLPETVLAVNLHSGATRTLLTRPGGSLSTILEATEDGREFIMEYTAPFPDFTNCVTEYHSTSTGALTRQITQPSSSGGCTEMWMTHSVRDRAPASGAGG